MRWTPDGAVRIRALTRVLRLRCVRYSHSVSLHSGVRMGECCDGLASHLGGSKNTPSRFMLQKLCKPTLQIPIRSLIGSKFLFIYLFIYLLICLFVCLFVCLFSYLLFYKLRPDMLLGPNADVTFHL